MRLVYFAHYAGGSDAASAMDRDLFEALRAQGHEVTVLSPYRRPEAGRIAGDVGGGRLPRLVLAVSGYVRMILEGLRRTRNPDVRIASQYHVFQPATFVAFVVARMRGRSLVVRAHDPLPGSYRSETQGGLFRAAFRLYRRILSHRQTWLLVPSPELWLAATERFHLPLGRPLIVPNNVTPFRDADRSAMERLRESLGLRGARVILQFGSFTADGVVTLLDALLRLPPIVKALILTDPGRALRFREEGTRRGISDRLVVVPTVPHDRLPEYLALADVCVGILSAEAIAFGSMPRNTLEAMAAEKPVVLSDGVVSSTLVKNRETGLLVPPRDVDALVVALLQLLEDPQLAADLGRHAREHVRAHFHSDAVAREFVAAIEGIP